MIDFNFFANKKIKTKIKKMKQDENKKLDLTYERLVIKESIPQDPEALKIIQEFDAVVGKKMEKTLGKIGVDLDGRFNKIRTQETGLSNWIADIMKSALKSDIAILNSGLIFFFF